MQKERDHKQSTTQKNINIEIHPIWNFSIFLDIILEYRIWEIAVAVRQKLSPKNKIIKLRMKTQQ
jgi:hypothetical protein